MVSAPSNAAFFSRWGISYPAHATHSKESTLTVNMQMSVPLSFICAATNHNWRVHQVQWYHTTLYITSSFHCSGPLIHTPHTIHHFPPHSHHHPSPSPDSWSSFTLRLSCAKASSHSLLTSGLLAYKMYHFCLDTLLTFQACFTGWPPCWTVDAKAGRMSHGRVLMECASVCVGSVRED